MIQSAQSCSFLLFRATVGKFHIFMLHMFLAAHVQHKTTTVAIIIKEFNLKSFINHAARCSHITRQWNKNKIN